MAITLSVLSIGPRVRIENNRLVASTGWSFLIPTLGLWRKHLVVDPAARELDFTFSFFWLFWLRYRIPFHDVKEVIYRYDNIAPFHSFTATDALDCFKVGVVTNDRDEYIFFRWIGEGEFGNNSLWPDWCYWDQYMIDFKGTQDKESMVFFELLRGTIFPSRARPSVLNPDGPRGFAIDTGGDPTMPAAPPTPRRAKPGVRPVAPPNG